MGGHISFMLLLYALLRVTFMKLLWFILTQITITQITIIGFIIEFLCRNIRDLSSFQNIK